MIKRTRELKIGIVVIVVITVFIWGFNYLKGHNIFNGAQEVFYTKYANVQGLNTASVVTVNGFEVGRVVDISFDPEKRGELIVTFTLEKAFKFGKNSIAKIYSASLMGGKSLAIIPDYESELAVSGDVLKGEIESDIFSSVGEKLNPLQSKLESVIAHVDSVMVNVNQIIDKESQAHIKDIIKNLSLMSANLEQLTKNTDVLIVSNTQSLQKSMVNIENATGNFSKISDTIVNANIGGLIAKMDSTLQNLESISTTINKGDGTVGKLVNDPAVYDNLEKTTKELGELLEDLKLNPKRYVHFSLFGKNNKPYEPKDSIQTQK